MTEQTQNRFNTNPPDRQAYVERLEKEISDLHKQQNNYLQSATFLGMKPQEEKEYDARCSQMVRLWQQLSLQLQRVD